MASWLVQTCTTGGWLGCVLGNEAEGGGCGRQPSGSHWGAACPPPGAQLPPRLARGPALPPLQYRLRCGRLITSLHTHCLTSHSTCHLAAASHAQVKGFTGPEQLAQALQGAELVVIPAGVPRKPGMTRDDLFNINAGGWGRRH